MRSIIATWRLPSNLTQYAMRAGGGGSGDQMKTWSVGVVESWSIGLIRLRAILQYSNIPIPRLRLCLTLCAVLFALCPAAEAQQIGKVARVGYLDEFYVHQILKGRNINLKTTKAIDLTI